MTNYSLRRTDKGPFGVFVAYQAMEKAYPNADFYIADKSPYFLEPGGNEGAHSINDSYSNGKNAYFILHDEIWASAEEVEALLQYAREGNHIFISSNKPPQALLASLSLKINNDRFSYPDSLNVSVNHPATGKPKTFAYPAYNFDSFFEKIENTDIEVLGNDKDGKPNFVKINFVTNGAIFIHLAPSAFTNYFLLYKNNIEFFNYALAHLPNDIEVVYWDDYFLIRNFSSGESKSFSALDFFRNNEILKWAYWIAIAVLISLLVLETSRRQKVIPIRRPVENISLNFIRTIGNLYFQKKNNNDLGYKMTLHFMDYARSKYQVSSAALNSDFIQRLSNKSGYELNKLEDIARHAKLIKDTPNVVDQVLLDYNQLLEAFYKHK